MAVSGKKALDFQGSISCGSAEADERNCDPCHADGHQEDAYGYCVDCEEHLCRNCFRCHKNSRGTRHHQLLDRANMDKRPIPTKPPATITEKCHVHSNELIKFFCPQHEALGCHDCITLEHRTCKIDYIPEICSGIGDSKLYKDTLTQMEDQVKEADESARKAKAKDKEVCKLVSEAFKDIDTFEKEMICRITELTKKAKKEVRDNETKDKQAIQKALNMCKDISATIKKDQSNMAAAKASNQEGQLYIYLTKARAKLHSNALWEADPSIDKIDTKYTFQGNKDLDSYLSNTSTLGNLITTESYASSTKKLKINKLKHTEDINVSTSTDQITCQITGCAVLSNDKVVLADYNNSKIKIVDTLRRTVEREKQLDTEPSDVTKLPGNQIAVTLPKKQVILILNSDSQLKAKGYIPAKKGCHGITFHDNCLYVVNQDLKCVFTLDIQGNIKHKFSLDPAQSFSCPECIVYSKYNKLLYISDWESNMVVSMKLQGEVTAVYKHKDLSEPMGMVVMEDGSLLVCCYGNKTIHHISGDLKQGQIVADNLDKSYSICFGGQVITGGDNCDLLEVFNLQ